MVAWWRPCATKQPPCANNWKQRETPLGTIVGVNRRKGGVPGAPILGVAANFPPFSSRRGKARLATRRRRRRKTEEAARRMRGRGTKPRPRQPAARVGAQATVPTGLYVPDRGAGEGGGPEMVQRSSKHVTLFTEIFVRSCLSHHYHLPMAFYHYHPPPSLKRIQIGLVFASTPPHEPPPTGKLAPQAKLGGGGVEGYTVGHGGGGGVRGRRERPIFPIKLTRTSKHLP